MTIANSITVRRAAARGISDHGWLHSAHSFSFADYHDPRHMGFRSLRVINDDKVAPTRGFGRHPHRDMEIFSYVVSGQLEHQDSMGNGRVLEAGEIQLMSAGKGVFHSECNPSTTDAVAFLQIWIMPNEHSLEPSYTEWKPTEEQRNQSKVLVISPTGEEGSATIHQDAKVYRVRLEPGMTMEHSVAVERGVWLQIVKGQGKLNGLELRAGDGASTEAPGSLQFFAETAVEALLFDLGEYVEE